MKTTTIRKHGQKLPLGFLVSGELNRDFRLRPHTAATDRMINIWREANVGTHVSMLVAKYLSLVIESAGGESYPLNPDGNSSEETVVRFLDWTFGDVMYAYLYARIIAVEEWMEVGFGCPTCGNIRTTEVDLWDTEVDVIESAEELQAWITLKNGMRLDNGKTCRKLLLRSVPYRALTLPGGSQEGTDSMGYNQLRESVIQVDGADTPSYSPTDGELDRITKLDMLRLDRQAGKVAAGPKLRTHAVCQHMVNKDTGALVECGTKILNALDWRYDSFFDSSVPQERLMS